MKKFLEQRFGLSSAGVSIGSEALAGLATFLTMAYIIFVNPAILGETGMDKGAVFVATCLAAAIGSILMGCLANYPIALAPGMGLNAFFTYTVVGQMGHSWQVALGAVFLSGVLFLALSVLPVREWIFNAIPKSLKLAISAGIGLFLAVIALKNAGIIVVDKPTLARLGDVTSGPALLAFFGFFALVALDRWRVPGAILLAILGVTLTGAMFGFNPTPGLFSLPPSPAATFLAMDIVGALEVGFISVVLAFLMVDLFDTAGTLVGLSHRFGLLDKDGRLPRLKGALYADSIATVAGAGLGTSTTTSYIESAAGMRAGGRTGLTAIFTGFCFVAALFLAPLATSIPSFATAPALLFVACLMAQGLADLDWNDATEYAPAFLTAIGIPLTFSIADGIGLGFIAYVGIKLLAGRRCDLDMMSLTIAVVFAAKFLWL
ncbi:MAG: guanine permease [Rhodospirillaceae bacterium]|nr:guanine permease [Rhodospirillaceae bacterium]HAA90887.1 guanine permease [Rhodospirillaceae bacterium]